MAQSIRLRVVTPSRLLLDEEVEEVTAPGALGEFGVLPDHIAFLSLLEPGELSYRQGASRTYLAVRGGYAEVLDNTVTVLADAAEFREEIDVERAREARDGAERRMQQLNPDDPEYAAAQAVQRWAVVELRVANREGRK
ncbi:MAG TPA: F0F1 ATP synthase subunit epsilon [candidate division Zixibacteria bacterium]|nr:F0F1 ATP synthase subunit epsilon [candidate division Zixibacteria bacterium]